MKRKGLVGLAIICLIILVYISFPSKMDLYYDNASELNEVLGLDTALADGREMKKMTLDPFVFQDKGYNPNYFSQQILK